MDSSLEGKIFNRWKVVDYSLKKNGIHYWKCACACGTIKLVNQCNLLSDLSRSCGCLRSEFASTKKIDLVGKKFNRLLVIDECVDKKCTEAVWNCECECGNITKVKASKLKNGSTKSCGCYTRERIKIAGTDWARSKEGRKIISERNRKRVGTLAANWKGGLEEENIRLRYSVESRAWRQKVYERDGFLCQNCKIKGNRLNAHHIIPWASNPDLRFDINNGITLCKSCHIIEHKRGGNPKIRHKVAV